MSAPIAQMAGQSRPDAGPMEAGQPRIVAVPPPPARRTLRVERRRSRRRRILYVAASLVVLAGFLFATVVVLDMVR